MDNQNLGQSVPPVAPVPPVNYQAPVGGGFNPDTFTKNPKFMATVKTFAIYGTILAVANQVVTILTSSLGFLSYHYTLNIGSLIATIIYGAIGSAIGGAIFYYIFDAVKNWIKSSAFISKYINSIFTLFWIPTLVGTIISAAFALLGMLGFSAYILAAVALGMGGIFIGIIIGLVAHLVIYYFYAKAISAKLQGYYSW